MIKVAKGDKHYSLARIARSLSKNRTLAESEQQLNPKHIFHRIRFDTFSKIPCIPS